MIFRIELNHHLAYATEIQNNSLQSHDSIVIALPCDIQIIGFTIDGSKYC